MRGLRRGHAASDISIYFYLIYLYSTTGTRNGSIGGVRAATDRAMSDVASVDLVTQHDVASVDLVTLRGLAGLPIG